MTDEKKSEVAEPTFAQRLLELLNKFDNHPETELIDSWKLQHKDVFCSALSESELFVFRALSRKEYRDLQAMAESEEDYETRVVHTCLLWSSVLPEDLEKKAGTLPTLLEQIMQNSNFMPPQLAGQLVVKL